MKRKALILDRDGVVNVEKAYVHRIEDFEFVDGIFELCREAQRKGYLIIVITNQSGIARGFYTEEDFHRLTEWMKARFAERGVTISAVYYAPDHPQHGIGPYKRESPDRKPNPGMLLRAQREFNLDLGASLMLGDKASDIAAGRAAGVGTNVLLQNRGQTTISTDATHLEAGEEIGENMGAGHVVTALRDAAKLL